MTKSKTRIVGGEKLARRMHQVGEDMSAAARRAAAADAEVTADDMRSRAPVDKGELRSKIRVIDVGDGTFDVGPVDVEHAAFPEFGTQHMPAQPYATPAAEAARARLPGVVAAGVKQDLR